jgi:hypothetical protein
MRTDRLAALVMAALPALAGAAPGNWDQPGRNPYTWSRWHAVMSYDNIPMTERVILGLRVQHDKPDLVTNIDKYGIRSMSGVDFTTDLRGMHFGQGKKYDTVSRQGWSEYHVEPASVWCHGEWCIVRPWVCGNISWATRAVSFGLRQGDDGGDGVQSVPEPSAAALLGVALLALVLTRRH